MSKTRRFGRLRRVAARGHQPPARDGASPRLTLLLLSLPGLAAVAALLFTWLQVGQAGKELRIAEEGQITNRFNTAVVNLGSNSVDVRLGGIYALERIMKDSAEDQPSVVSVLSAYVRRHAPVPPTAPAPAPDVQAAMNVLVRRRPDLDGGVAVDLSRTALPNWKPSHVDEARSIQLPNAVLTGADLSGADLASAVMPGAFFDGAKLTSATLADADLTTATLNDADLGGASFWGADLENAEFGGSDLHDAVLFESKLRGAIFCLESTPLPCARNLTGTRFGGADLTQATLEHLDLRKALFCDRETFRLPMSTSGEVPTAAPSDVQEIGCAVLRETDLEGARLSAVDLSGADLRGAVLIKADLSGADLRKANLTGADLTGANLAGAKLAGAVLTRAKGLPPSWRAGGN
ncbi:pentapeptide repeat-containing protein [Streptomyces sp. NPDC059071]|uniref:pentapeptide repeat-containing protein n=1 Tax=unclassified Streptomyces TaxID=2593676 RepID=UPI00365EB4BF